MVDPIRRRGLNARYPEDDVVATPEGDNEYPADVPVGPVEGLQVAGGNAPLAYDADKDKRNHPHEDPQNPDHPTGHSRTTHEGKDEVEETVDKLSVGQILA